MRSLEESAGVAIAARVLGAAMMIAMPAAAVGQAWPSKPIRLVVGFGSGSPPDLFGRLLAGPLGEDLGHPVIVENRPGAGSMIANLHVANAAPDGYTIATGTLGTLALGPALFPSPGFDPLRSFAPVGMVARAPIFLVVHPSVPATNVRAFLEHAKSRATPLLYGSGGFGSPPHLVMEMLKHRAGVDLVHVPYKNTQIPPIVAGDVHATMASPAVFGAAERSGKVRLLAVASERRDRGWPDVPTFDESGVSGMVAHAWTGVVAPHGTPAPVVARLNQALKKTVESPAMRSAFGRIFTEPAITTPETFGAFIASEVEKWGAVMRAAGVKAE